MCFIFLQWYSGGAGLQWRSLSTSAQKHRPSWQASLPLNQSAPVNGADLDCGCHKPMLAIPVDSIFLFAVSPECRSCPCFSAVFSRSFPFGKSWRNIPFRRSFSCQLANKKTDTQRHQKTAGALLSLQNDETMYRLWNSRTGLFFIRLLADSTQKHKVRMAVFSLSIPQALGGLRRFLNQNILYSVVVLV